MWPWSIHYTISTVTITIAVIPVDACTLAAWTATATTAIATAAATAAATANATAAATQRNHVPRRPAPVLTAPHAVRASFEP